MLFFLQRNWLTALLLVFCCLAQGCYFSGYSSFETRVLGAQTRLDPAQKLYVALPWDYATAEGDEVSLSGKRTQDAFRKGLGPRADAYATHWEDAVHGLAKARERGCGYYVSVRLVEWVDRLSIDNSLDSGEALVTVYNVATGDVIRVDSVRCSGRSQRIFYVGSDTPADCLADGFEEWAELVFTGTIKKKR